MVIAYFWTRYSAEAITSSSTVKLDRVASAVLLVMASAEYLVQK